MIALTETDLLDIISRDELTGIAEQHVEAGQEDPIQRAIDGALGTVQLYIDPYSLPDAALRKIWTILAVAALYTRLGDKPEKRQKEEDWALETLKDVRDGKFTNLESSAPAIAAWGSQTRLKMPSGS